MEPGAHRALCRAAVDIIEAIPKYKAPQTSAKWTKFRQKAGSYLQFRGGRQTLPGAAGFWASRELPVVVWADYALYIVVVCLC